MKIKDLAPKSVVRFASGVEAVCTLLLDERGRSRDLLYSKVVSIDESGAVQYHRNTVFIVKPDEEVSFLGTISLKQEFDRLISAQADLSAAVAALEPELSDEEKSYFSLAGENFHPARQFLRIIHNPAGEKRPLVLAAREAELRLSEAEREVRESESKQIASLLGASLTPSFE